MSFLLTTSSRRKFVRILGGALGALAVAQALYFFLNIERIITRIHYVTPLTTLDILFSASTTFLVILASYLSVSVVFGVLVTLFFLYGFIGQYLPYPFYTAPVNFLKLLEFNYLDIGGMFGIPIMVSNNYIFLFILLSAFLAKAGAAKLFTDLAMAVTGRMTGGPAKASVISSGLVGTISGSAVANVLVTGTFTIPTMKRAGYDSEFAGAVEAIASTGGQLMPPVMGAAAFVMAELLGITYWEVVVAAALPAVLYYLAIFFMVDVEARRKGLKGIPPSQLPSLRTILPMSHLLIPLVGLVIVLAMGYTPNWAALTAIVLTIPLSMIRKDTRLNLQKLLRAFVEASVTATQVAMACAGAGILIGMVSVTGLGLRLSSIMKFISGGNTFILLILLMVTALILGTGMPTTGAYLTVATLLVPALVLMGLNPIVAHLFAFYFAIISMVTPPVCLSAYAAAGIAGSNPFKTGLLAFRLGIVAYLIPFAFVFNPSLVLIGSPIETVSSFLLSILGAFGISIGIIGYFKGPLNIAMRVMILIPSVIVILSLGYITYTSLLFLIMYIAILYYYRKRVRSNVRIE
jgi:TRAP transporter 4TM/12TM fusion protein